MLTALLLTLLSLTSLFTVSSSLSCTNQESCYAGGVTTNYNYAQCVNGTCQCTATFLGSATTSSPCSCSGTDYGVYWGNGIPKCIQCSSPWYIEYDRNDNNPYCTNPAYFDSLIQNYNNMKNVIIEAFGYNLFPVPAAELTLSPDQITWFTDDATSRVTPVSPPGSGFPGRNVTLEYIYASAAGSNITRINIRAIYPDPISSVTSFCLDFLVSDPLKDTSFNVSTCGNARFEDGKISAWDGYIPNIGIIEDVTDPIQQQGTIEYICSIHQSLCIPNGFGQYADYDACVSALNNITFGSFFTAGVEHSVTCMILHTLLIVEVPYFGPQQHCPHIGPDSVYCRYSPYSDYFSWDPVGDPEEYVLFEILSNGTIVRTQ